MRRVVLLLAGLAAAGPASGQEAGVGQVAAWLTGTFDSSEQAKGDSTHRDVRLVSVLVPKSRLSLGAPVIYLEMASAAAPDRPFRQRFYRIEDGGDGKVLMRLYDPKDPITVSGKWRDPSDLALFGFGDVVERSSCLMTFRKTDESWEGSGAKGGCNASLLGARYTTLQVALSSDRIEWWERGFDSSGQIWGPTNGPDRFRRRSTAVLVPPAPPEPAASGPRPTPAAPVASQPSLVVKGIGETKTLGLDELKALPAITWTEKGHGSWRGARLSEVFRRCGLASGDMAARRLLAPAVVLAAAEDGYIAAFSVEELLTDGSSALVAYEKNGKPLEAAEGPLAIQGPVGPTRRVRNLAALELRFLASNVPEAPPEIRK